MSIQDDTTDFENGLKQSKSNLGKDVAQSLQDVQKVKEDVTTVIQGIKAASNDSAHAAASYVRGRVNDIRESSADTLEDIEGHIRSKPSQSVAIAFLVGAVASYLFGRRSA